jgi:segregation and condensation protein B
MSGQDRDIEQDRLAADELVGDTPVDGSGDAVVEGVAADAVIGDPPAVSEPESAPLIETIDAADVVSPAAAGDEPPVAPDVSDLPPAELRAALESLLFVATRPLTIERLQRCLPGTSETYLEGFLTGLAERFDRERRGWELRRIAGGWQLLTRRELYPWVRQLERRELPTKLSKSALETLAIVAYKQPITRGAIEDIRGVQCGPVLRQLMDLKLVLVSGRDDEAIGRPLLYATTDAFLSRFGLGRIEDLPRRHEFGA